MQLNAPHFATMLFSRLPTCVLDQYVAHCIGNRSEEVPTAIPTRILDARNAHVGFVYERGRLKRLSLLKLLHQ